LVGVGPIYTKDLANTGPIKVKREVGGRRERKSPLKNGKLGRGVIGRNTPHRSG